MPRQRIAVPFGRGLDRGLGKMVVDPASIEDARNVYLSNGRALVRRGMEEWATFLDDEGNPCTDVTSIHPMRSEQVGIVTAYQSATGKMFVYRVFEQGLAYTPLLCESDDGPRLWWHQLTAGSPPPRVIPADSYQRLFLAHDEPAVLERAETVYYDPFSGVPVQRLLLDLTVPATGEGGPEGDGRFPVRFRGVARHLAYIWGWGWGAEQDGERDRPEMIRHSLPANPLAWEPTDYQIIGQRGEPILMAKTAGVNLVVGKPAELHRIFGYDRRTFGHFDLDTVYGLEASRLMISWKNGVAFWSSCGGGPRYTNGVSASEELERDQLDLLGLEPSDLVAPDEAAYGFACDLTDRKVLYFFFGARAYALHYGTPKPEWSYDERAVPLLCAGELFTTQEAGVEAPTGHPEFIPSDDATFPWPPEDFSASPFWRNVGATGGEILEIWLRPEGGSWTLSGTRSVDPLAPVQRATPAVTPLTADTDYEIAYRYRRGGLYTAGYNGNTPDDWTASTAGLSKGTFTTPLTMRVFGVPQWRRDSNTEEFMGLAWSGGPTANTEIYKSTDGVAFTLVDTVSAGTTTYDYAPLAGEPETYLWFYVQPTGGAQSSVRQVWVGPARPFGYDPYPSACDGCPPHLWRAEVQPSSGTQWLFGAAWVNSIANLQTELEFETEGSPGFAAVMAGSVGATNFPGSPTPLNANTFAGLVPRGDGPVKIRIRSRLTSHGVDDFSDWLESAAGTTVPGTS